MYKYEQQFPISCLGSLYPQMHFIRMKVQRYKCKECNFDQQEKIPFATNSCSYTHRFAKYVVDLLLGMTLHDVSNHLDVSWDTVKKIHSSYLKRHYSPPSLDGVENIGID
ncbi:helix-turn-helix domain-containing protein, partial [Segatella salivae]|uniref:helix-turn-helix domain-containing protein n=1 Tax=Segatella salivae TaxID=228604 RepID=UPI00241CF332